MTVVVFPDTCLLVNFAVIGGMELLAGVVGDKGRWTHEMYCEVTGWRGELATELARAQTFLPDPLMPSGAEAIDRGLIRAALAAPGDSATDHLGEAEMLAIIDSRFGGESVIVASEDRGVHTYCQGRGLRVMCTRDVLALCVRAKRVTHDQANGYLVNLRQAGRWMLQWHPIEPPPPPTPNPGAEIAEAPRD